MLYSRRGCHLCERAEEWLAFQSPEAVVVAVDDDPASAAAYGLRVPVVEIDGVVTLEGRFTEADLADVICRGSAPGDAGHR